MPFTAAKYLYEKSLVIFNVFFIFFLNYTKPPQKTLKTLVVETRKKQ